MKKQDNNVQFRKTGVSGKSVASLIAGILTLLTFLTLVLWSGLKNETPKAFAFCGTAALVVSFIGLLVSVKCLREQDGGYKVIYAGIAVNGITFVAYLVTYMIGLV